MEEGRCTRSSDAGEVVMEVKADEVDAKVKATKNALDAILDGFIVW